MIGNKRVKATMDEVQDGTLGGCTCCGEINDGCEPDARDYQCAACGQMAVFGLEELVVMMRLDVVEDEDDCDDE